MEISPRDKDGQLGCLFRGQRPLEQGDGDTRFAYTRTRVTSGISMMSRTPSAILGTAEVVVLRPDMRIERTPSGLSA